MFLHIKGKVPFEILQTEVTSLLLKSPLTESDQGLGNNGFLQNYIEDYWRLEAQTPSG